MRRLKQGGSVSQRRKLSKVLVVDDDPIIRDMMVDILDCEGYEIRTASNGYEAWEILGGEEGYLVFLDRMMAGMSGEALCAALDADPALRSRHVVVLMSALDRLTEGACVNVDATIPKPFSVDEVLAVIEPYM